MPSFEDFLGSMEHAKVEETKPNVWTCRIDYDKVDKASLLHDILTSKQDYRKVRIYGLKYHVSWYSRRDKNGTRDLSCTNRHGVRIDIKHEEYYEGSLSASKNIVTLQIQKHGKYYQ